MLAVIALQLSEGTSGQRWSVIYFRIRLNAHCNIYGLAFGFLRGSFITVQRGAQETRNGDSMSEIASHY